MAKKQSSSKKNVPAANREELVGQIKKLHKLKSAMAVPVITKVTVSMGMGQSALDKKELEAALKEMELITGQKPVVTRVRRSEANFKIRQGWPIGVKVTLRREKMHQFLDYLLTITLPAVREFRGFDKKSLDQQGNLSFGIPDQSVFRSIPFEMISTISGMVFCVTTSGRDREMSFDLLKLMGFPFKQAKGGESNGN